jgi:CheY-like chemotaxis protein/two-component sensor histidine kinase
MEGLRAMMERQVRQLCRLIDDLLDVSRITRGKIELRRQEVELDTIISAAIESVRPLIDASGHELAVQIDGNSPTLDADVARLTQAFGNLLNNAIKYTPSGGRICIASRSENGQAVVSIEDNGIGIPPHMLTRIFEMFQQVDQSLSRSRDGLGLGLTLVKRLVELHGGTISAHSEGPGHGSRFEVRLPIQEAAAGRSAPRGAETHRTNGFGHYRILVVDDVPASAKTLAMMLKSIGQQAEIQFDGAAAIDYVQTNHPEVVFLDIAMPGMNGYEVAKRLRASQSGSDTVLVALTGYGDDDSRRRSLEAGFDRHLTKPISMDQLHELMRSLPAAQRARAGAARAD